MKKKFLSILAVAAVASCCAISASAAVYDQVTLVYDETESTETVKVVDVYCAGDVTYGGVLDFLVEGVTISDYSFATADGMFDTSTVRGDWTNVDAGQLGWAIITKSGDTETFNGAPIATLTLTVPEGAGDFTVELAGESAIGDADWNEDIIEYDTKITIPGATVEDEPVEVKTTGKLYADYADAAVYACVADAVTVADVTGKTLTWNIKAADKVVGTTPVNVGTVLSGEESTVVFGLMIVNDNDTAGFNTIDSAVLVIE